MNYAILKEFQENTTQLFVDMVAIFINIII